MCCKSGVGFNRSWFTQYRGDWINWNYLDMVMNDSGSRTVVYLQGNPQFILDICNNFKE